MSISAYCSCFPCCSKTEVYQVKTQKNNETAQEKSTTLFLNTIASPKSSTVLLATSPISFAINNSSLQSPSIPISIRQNFFSDNALIHQDRKNAESPHQNDLVQNDSHSRSQSKLSDLDKQDRSEQTHHTSNSKSESSCQQQYISPVSPLQLSKLQPKNGSLRRAFSDLSLSSPVTNSTRTEYADTIYTQFYSTFEELCRLGFSQEISAMVTEYAITNWEESFYRYPLKIQKRDLFELIKNTPLLTRYIFLLQGDATEFTDDDFTHFSQLTNLQSLSLTSCRHLTPSCLSYLQKLEKLTHITLEDCSHFLENVSTVPQLTFEAEQNLLIAKKANPKLVSISLSEMTEKNKKYDKKQAARMTLHMQSKKS